MNFMHSCSLEGARTSGVILSIYRKPEENGLDPVNYLKFLFDRIPNLEGLSDELLPWKYLAQASCNKPHTKNTK